MWRSISGNMQSLLKTSTLQTKPKRIVRMGIMGRSTYKALFMWKADRVIAATMLLLEPVLKYSKMSYYLNACSAKYWLFFFVNALWLFNNVCVANIFYFAKSLVYSGDGKTNENGCWHYNISCHLERQNTEWDGRFGCQLCCAKLELLYNCWKAEIVNDVSQVIWPELGIQKSIWTHHGL